MTADPSIQLILEKAGYGLARKYWLLTLRWIRGLPEVKR